MGSPDAHKVLFEPSKCVWQVWALILNIILHLLPSCWGFSFALGHGVFFFGGIQLFLPMVIQKQVVILEFLQEKSACPSTPPFLRKRGFPCGSAGKEYTCNVGDLDLIPGLGRSPGEGKGYPLQYSGLENSMDWATESRSQSQTRLSGIHFHNHLGKRRITQLPSVFQKVREMSKAGRLIVHM